MQEEEPGTIPSLAMSSSGKTQDPPSSQPARLSEIVELAAPVILQMDDRSFIQFASGYYLESLGLSASSIIGNHFREFIGSHHPTLEVLQRVLAGEFGIAEVSLGNRKFEIRLTPNANEEGLVTGATAVFIDITHRANATAELKRSEASFRVLIESSPDAVIVHRFGRIIYTNEATCRLLRHNSVQSLLGTPVLELFCREDRANLARRITTATQSMDSTLERYKLLRKDGIVSSFEVTTMAIQYDGDAAVVHIARDVTQALRMQQSLAKTERLASLGTLAGGVGHEINNPLAYMTANLSFISEELVDRLPADLSAENQDIHSALQDVRDGTDRVRDIVRQLNEFNRVDASTEELVDPRVGVETAIRMSWNHIRRRARVETELNAVGSVRGNIARLGQVFLALLLNATQAMGDRPVSECSVRVRCFDQDENVIIEISDNGPGIPEEILSNIFDPFFTTHSEGQGTGLGLAVAHSIISEMQGTIDAESQLGQGTLFRIQLPRVRDKISETKGEKRILVITDEVRFLESVQIALRGNSIRIAGRMSIGIEDLQTTPLSAVICDLSSADVDISTFGQRANRLTEALVFVAQSGTTITMAEAELASVLLRKPVGADTLSMQLNALWS